MKIMSYINDWDAFKKVMQETEAAYVEESGEGGTYVGFGPDWPKHKFVEDCIEDFPTWLEGMCAGVFKNYLKNPDQLGCDELADGAECLACGCRNYCFCLFVTNSFEDWEEFLKWCIAQMESAD